MLSHNLLIVVCTVEMYKCTVCCLISLHISLQFQSYNRDGSTEVSDWQLWVVGSSYKIVFGYSTARRQVIVIMLIVAQAVYVKIDR